MAEQAMKVGVVFPSTDIADRHAVRDYVQAVEGLGYSHLAIWDHVLGIDVTGRPGWADETYTLQNVHEALVLLGYITAVTERIELTTGILVLPQRQTAIVAKQAAEIDVLSQGRLRLGVGVGYLKPEFDALDADFGNRGRRMEEQVSLMRALWTEDVVTFHGDWHAVDRLGIRPLPMQRPIPVWIGGYTDRALSRVVKMGDGWITATTASETLQMDAVERLRTFAAQVGRQPDTIGIDGYVNFSAVRGGAGLDDYRRELDLWIDLGASHVSVNTTDWRGHRFPGSIDGGFAATVGEHIKALELFRDITASS